MKAWYESRKAPLTIAVRGASAAVHADPVGGAILISVWQRHMAAVQGVFQVIDTSSGAVDNLVEFKFASAVRGSLNVAGTVAPAEAGRPVSSRLTAEAQQRSQQASSVADGCKATMCEAANRNWPPPASTRLLMSNHLQAKEAGGPVTRVDVRFTAFRLQLGWLAFSLPLGWADPKVSSTTAHSSVSTCEPSSTHEARHDSIF